MEKPAAEYADNTEPLYSDELPIQLESDALGCPRCMVKLSNSKSKVFVDGIDIGSFDSIACKFCSFFLLTEKGFDESAKAIVSFGLDMPEQDDVHKRPRGDQNDSKENTTMSESMLGSTMDWNSSPPRYVDNYPLSKEELAFVSVVKIKKHASITESSLLVTMSHSITNR